MAAYPLPPPAEDGIIRVTFMGFSPVADYRICPACYNPVMLATIAYSTALSVVCLEQAGFCEDCDSVVLGELWDED